MANIVSLSFSGQGFYERFSSPIFNLGVIYGEFFLILGLKSEAIVTGIYFRSQD
jgi:hypothetical protein